jgi:hypothetical protein
MTEPHEVITPMQNKSGILTRVFASVRLGRGVVGNTTFGLWAVSLLALGATITFVTKGYPEYGLTSLGMCMVFYIFYQISTWVGVYFNTDAGAAADEDYAHVVATRHLAAKNPRVVRSRHPQLGGTMTSETSDHV